MKANVILFIGILLSIVYDVASGWDEKRNLVANICPKTCACLDTSVRCTLQRLISVPNVPANTTILDLRFNEIVSIEPGILLGLEELRALYLNENRIERIPSNAFKGLANLKILYLFGNRIERIFPDAFDDLTNLEELYLNDNRLTRIEKKSFVNLVSLDLLYLQGNDLRSLSSDAFSNVGPLTRLRLDGNPLVCDCELSWLVERSIDYPTEVEITCIDPNNAKNIRSLNEISPNEFHCREPKITEGPKDAEVILGSRVNFVCRVEGNPKPRIKWMRNSEEIRVDGLRYHSSPEGNLTIDRVTSNDSGVYECVAINEVGEIKSRKARAVIATTRGRGEPPLRFVRVPESQKIIVSRETTTRTKTRMNCVAEGIEPVSIEWWKNARRLITSDRIVVTEEGTRLYINEAKPEDSGRYACRAINRYGMIETSADLEIIVEDKSREFSRKPKLTYPPEDMEAETGTTVEVACRAEGDPKPRISWKKDGATLTDIGERYRLSRGGSLYLYNVTISDSGRYECTGYNVHGRATAGALVRVRPTRPSANDALILRAFNEAENSIDRAINRTIESLIKGGGERNRVNPYRLSRFPDAVGRAAARPAELFERTLINVRKLLDSVNWVNATDEFRYEDLLTREQVAIIEKLSECTGHRRSNDCRDMCYHARYRTIDGSCNNLGHPTWGSSYTGFRRIILPRYENGFSTPIGWESGRLYHGFSKPSARLVSTKLISTNRVTSDAKLSHMVMQWGQFLDHDLDHALPAVSSESWDGIDCKKSCDNAAPCFPIAVPPGDPRVTNRRCIDFIRTSAVCGSGETSVLWGKLTPREQLNQLTSYLDASQVYGYDDTVAKQLRSNPNNENGNEDRGLLREGPTFPGRKPLLPYASGEFVDCRRNEIESSINCFLAGDIRANEQVGLLAMHSIWLREHNRIARELGRMNPHWDGETVYQEARQIVGAEMQHITYRHWIPLVLGADIDTLLGPYRGYDPNLDASIANVFATAALRFGHSLIQPKLERLNESLLPTPEGPLSLRDAFFSPWRLVEEGGVDPLIRGMFATAAKLKLPEENLNLELTEQLFRNAHAVALDLAAMNVQRSRDHGIVGYLEWREYCNMSVVETFDDLSNEIGSPEVRRKLEQLYGHPGNVDVWVGGILEDQLPGAKVGPLFRCLLLEQFERTRHGDRFWYENPSALRPDQLTQIKQASLARILCDNGDNITRIQSNVFLLPDDPTGYGSCDDIPRVDLRMWSECCDECDDRRTNDVSRFKRAAFKYSRPERDETRSRHREDKCSGKLESMENDIFTMKRELNDLTRELKRLRGEKEPSIL